MRKLKASPGMTLVELMIATAVAAVLSAAALQLFAGLIKYSRVTAMTTDLNDRMRTAREIITHDVLAAGYYWRKEALTGSNPADLTTLTENTAVFGSAGKASGMDTWPRVPVSGVDSNAASDTLYLLVPSGGLVGANFNIGHADYECKTVGNMVVTAHSTANPDWGGLSNTKVVAGTSGNFIFLSYVAGAFVSAAVGATAFQIAPLGSVVSALPTALPAIPPALPGDECEVAGKTAGDPLPGRLVVYPIEGVVWAAAGGDLRRCSGTTAAAGPTSFTVSNCPVVLGGFEDFQVRYRYLRGTVDIDGNPTSMSECLTDDPSMLSDPHAQVAMVNSAGAACGAAMRKRRSARNDGTSYPMLRFVGYELGLVGATLKPDHKEYLNKGRRPALFNHGAAGANDSFRRARHTWRVSAPNFYIF